MFSFVVYSLEIFFTVLDCIVLLYLVRNLFLRLPFGEQIARFLVTLMLPMWMPIQWLLHKSILQTMQFDISPYILLLILTYFQGICSMLLHH